jgi:4-amino-4-deoxy-L-arabinose transferase-like glycosyltransferase
LPRFVLDHNFWVLIAIVAGALGLRLWGLDYGLPISYFQDEFLEVMRALQLGTGSFQLDRVSKGGLYLLLFVEYGFYFLFLKFTGSIGSGEEFARLFVNDPSVFYLLGRVTTALFGSATVLVAYLLARSAYSVGAGLLAALFMSVNVLHVGMSHMINVDIMMVLFSSLALYFAIRLAEEGAAKSYLAAAAMAGIATTAKIPAMLLLIPLLIAHTYNMARPGLSLRTWLYSRHLWIGVVTFAVVVIGTNPGILLHITDYVGHFTGGSAPASPVASDGVLQPVSLPQRPNLYEFYLVAMQRSMGWPLFVLCIFGLAYGLWRRSRADVILLPFAVLFFVVISSTQTDLYYDRYALPVILVLSVLAARALDDAVHSLRAWRSLTLATTGFLLIAAPATQAISKTYLLTQTDNRTLAQHWIEANIPHGSRVMIEGARFAPNRTGVALQETVEGLKHRIDYWRAKDPRAVTYLQHKLAAAEAGVRYDLELIDIRNVGDLQGYRDAGVEYFVILPRRFLEHRTASWDSVDLVQQLRQAPDVELVKAFPAEPEKRRGPTVEIYRVNQVSRNTTD